MNRLFVYGTLAPGKPNEHVLADLDGTWEPATIRGTLHTAGWGAVSGFPVIILDAEGDIIKGQIFRSAQLASYWHVLDEFEGDAYKRDSSARVSRDNSLFWYCARDSTSSLLEKYVSRRPAGPLALDEAVELASS